MSSWVSVREMPRCGGFYATAGAGVIWASVAMGSGELIWWPILTAKYGPAFIGLLLPACILQYFVNREIGRYTVTTGEGLFQGFSRLHYLFTAFMWTMMLVTFLWVGSYITSGAVALFELTHFPQHWSVRAGSLFWAYCIMAVLSGALFAAKRALRLVDLLMRSMIFLSVICVAVTLCSPVILKTAASFFSAYLNPFHLLVHGMPSNWEATDSNIVLTAICFAGMGGFLNIMYSYWLRDKGVGMSKIKPSYDSPTGKFMQPTGYVFSDTPGNRRRYRTWLRFLALDNVTAVGLNAMMAMAMCWFSWSILLPKGIVPSGWEISTVQAEFFATSMGSMGRAIFLLITVAFLCDNWIGIVDACARMHADFFKSTFRFAQGYADHSLYRAFLVGMIIISFITVPVATPGSLLLVGGLLNFLAMPIYCPVLVYMNYWYLPKIYPAWVRPSVWSLVMISTVCAVYFALAGWYLWTIF